ncbi:MAG: helix-turn-helix domain-containing protein [Methanobrevibacter sp.]|jgi:transcriptional regulator with XRE-family HTH domain|nr:helix-turn-helix domain-containing protein [Candidatus Methanoflexus mossambicus]
MQENNAVALIELLNQIAIDKGLSRYKIAKETGISTTSLSNYFNGNNMPSLSAFLAIAKAVGVNFFFESKESETEGRNTK